jgi:phosphoesterase RecJ-like protein
MGRTARKRASIVAVRKEVKAIIEANQRFLITTHIFPDPDALGSELALCAFLRKLGKSPRIVNSDAPPGRLRFMDKHGWVATFDPSLPIEDYLAADALIVLDCSLLERVGRVADICRRFSGPIICMDHHIFEGGFASVNLIEVGRSAMGEMLYNLFKLFPVEIDRDIAEWLYLSIMADTRSFQFDVTTPSTHHVIARLLEFGLRPEQMFEKIYESNDLREAALFGRALSTLMQDHGGKILWFMITREMCEEAGVWPTHTDYFINFIRGFQGSDVVILFREDPDGQTKVSLRSKHEVDVNRIARAFGGGGHCCASGIDMECGLEEAIAKVLGKAREIL